MEPALSVATSGAWRASTPISPAAPGTISISASPSKVAPSGVTRETSKRRRSSATPAPYAEAASCFAFSTAISIVPTM